MRGPLPVLAPVLLLGSALLLPLVGLWRRRLVQPLALAGAGAAFATAVVGLWTVRSGAVLRHHLGGWAPPLGIEYVLDRLSAFLLTLVLGIGLVALAALRPSLEDECPGREQWVYPLALLLLAGLSGMVLTGDLFNLYVFLEISSLAAYALIATGGRGAPMAAFRYLILGSLGGGFYLLGVGFIYFTVGSLNMADVAVRLPDLYESRAVLAGAALMLVGLGVKMALFPLHLWQPDAYTFAPLGVSALLAPIMTKVAAYAVIRLMLDVFGPAYLRDAIPAMAIIGWLGALGILAGSLWAIAQQDYRRMLAYSSVSQIGYVALGLGLGTPLGLVGALLHILNHACMKAGLFLVGGAVRLRTGSTAIGRFAGLGRAMPWTMAAFTVLALAMIGVPPTAGFFSKWYLVLGGIEAGHWIFVAVIVFSSLLTAVYFVRVIEQVYRGPTGEPEEARGSRGETPASLLVPTLVLAGLVLVLGIGNAAIVTTLLQPVAAPLGGP